PPSPRAAMALIDARLAGWPRGRFAVAGSSLGGFYATVAAERWGCPAVLLNPAVDPARDLAAHIGEQTAWHDPNARFFFHPGFVDELRAMTPPAITHPQRYFAVIAKGDEVIDWREMVARYEGASVRLLEGSDHALSDFDDHLHFVLKALNLCD
ncbi:MAG: YqiA/YcfP family alpha/beta fold hydrolase, partial [Rubrivivax sp.]